MFVSAPGAADAAALASLGEVWAELAPASLARKTSALRQFYGFLVDEGLRGDDPSPALPRPRTRRPLPRLIGHAEVAARRLDLRPLKRATPLAFPLMVARFREKLTNETLGARIERMVAELDAAADA